MSTYGPTLHAAVLRSMETAATGRHAVQHRQDQRSTRCSPRRRVGRQFSTFDESPLALLHNIPLTGMFDDRAAVIPASIVGLRRQACPRPRRRRV